MRALLVKTSSLGDVVHALPAVTDAARAGIRFDWVVEEAFRAVPALHPAVDRVIPIAWRRWRGNIRRSRREMQSFVRDLVGEHYDLAIDSQGLLKSALVMSRVRAREKVGFSDRSAKEPAASLFYGRVVTVPKEQHAIARQRQLFSGAFGYSHEPTGEINFGLPHPAPTTLNSEMDADMRESSVHALPCASANNQGPAGNSTPLTGTEFSEGATATRCLLLHGASWPTKLWPEAMWTELARRAKDANLQPVLPWGNDEERSRAQRIAGASGAAPLPAMNLADLIEELRRARLAIGVDSGLAHLAGALGVPTVVLYGPTASARTGCRGNNTHNLQADFPCSPCLSRACRYRGSPVSWRGIPVTPPCYGALDPASVWAAALRAMQTPLLAEANNK